MAQAAPSNRCRRRSSLDPIAHCPLESTGPARSSGSTRLPGASSTSTVSGSTISSGARAPRSSCCTAMSSPPRTGSQVACSSAWPGGTVSLPSALAMATAPGRRAHPGRQRRRRTCCAALWRASASSTRSWPFLGHQHCSGAAPGRADSGAWPGAAGRLLSPDLAGGCAAGGAGGCPGAGRPAALHGLAAAWCRTPAAADQGHVRTGYLRTFGYSPRPCHRTMPRPFGPGASSVKVEVPAPLAPANLPVPPTTS
jgi:hypothetical protein